MFLDKIKLEENIEKNVKKDLEVGKIGGASVLIRQNGEVVYKNCFGFKGIEEKEPLKENTVFRLASMTKPITAVSTLMQIEKGKLRLDMPISELLPGFEKMYLADGDRAENKITVEDLLAHKSGLGSGEVGDEAMSKMTTSDKKDLKTVVNFYESIPLDFEPGSMASYSPVAAFDVLARLIELTSDMPFAEFVEKNISAPMELADLTLTPNEEQWQRMADMHNMVDGKAVNANMPKGIIFSDFPQTYTCGGAGCVSTITDYSTFAEMLLNKGMHKGRRIISEEMVSLMQTPFPSRSKERPGDNWALGVRVNKNGFYDRLPEGAFGWSGAYGTHFWVDNANKMTVVYMKNSFCDGGSGAVTAAELEEAVRGSFIK